MRGSHWWLGITLVGSMGFQWTIENRRSCKNVRRVYTHSASLVGQGVHLIGLHVEATKIQKQEYGSKIFQIVYYLPDFWNLRCHYIDHLLPCFLLQLLVSPQIDKTTTAASQLQSTGSVQKGVCASHRTYRSARSFHVLQYPGQSHSQVLALLLSRVSKEAKINVHIHHLIPRVIVPH